ncbi:MAG: PAS domain S-box protein [Caldilinea sp.]
MDTSPEPEFDDICRLAAQICEAPLALISFVDEDRQWFKAQVGVDIGQTPRESSFCADAILKPDEILVVPDTLADERFRDNPLVTGAPNIRAYAGAPLVTEDGLALGTLCILDTQPRAFTEKQLTALGILRRSVVNELHLRRQAANASSQQPMLYQFLSELTSQLDPDVIAWKAVNLLLGLNRWQSIGISMPSPDGQSWQTRAEDRMVEGEFGAFHSVDSGVIGRAYRTGEIQHVPDVTRDPSFFLGEDVTQVGSELAVPIKHKDRVLGVLNLESDQPYAFGADDISFAASLTEAIALALENARLYSLAKTEIVQRQQAEARFREIEQIYRQAIIAADAIPYVLDLTTNKYVFGLDMFLGHLGYSLDELTPEFFNNIHIESLPLGPLQGMPLQDALAHLRQGRAGPFWKCEHRLRASSGEECWFLDSAIQILDEDQRPTSSIGILQDITVRKQAEIELQSAKSRLQHLLTSSPAVIYSSKVSGEYDVTFISDNVCMLTGYAAEQFTGDQAFWMTHVHPDDASAFLAEAQDIHEHEIRSLEYRFLHHDGSYRWIQDDAILVRDTASNPMQVEIVGSCLDITERKQMEEALQQRLTMEQLVTAISTRFVSLSMERADEALDQTLAALGEFAGADRCYLFQFSDDRSTFTNTHEWCAEGIESFIETMQAIPTLASPWATGTILRNETLYVPRVADLPAEGGREKASFERQQIQSLLCIPLFSRRGVLGFMGFDSVRRERLWSEEDITLLKLADESISSALERWRAEQALHDLNRSLEQRVAERTAEAMRLVKAMDAAIDGLAILHEQRFAYVNPAYADLHGSTVQDLIGQPWRSLFQLSEDGVLVHAIESLAAISDRQQGTYTARTREGRTVEIEASLTLTEYGLIISERDVTQRVEAERALRQAEERYRMLFEEAPVMYVITRNVAGVPIITDCNQQFLTTLGYARDELVGQWLGRIYSPESQRQLEEGYQRALSTMLLDEERQLITRDGRVIQTLLQTRHVVDAAGRVTGTRAMYVNITARKQAEDKVRLLGEQYRNLARRHELVREEERTKIAREIHDDLGQMLTALKMDVAWLARRLPPDSPPLDAKIDAMHQLIDMTIRSVQRISSELRPNLLDTLGLVSAMEWQLQQFHKRTELATHFSTNAPEEFALDPGLATALFRIFQEALTNIIRHAQATTVEVNLALVEDHLRLTVSDDGVGFEPTVLTDPHSLGLIGMRERLVPWQGQVELKGAPRQGATVCVHVRHHLPAEGSAS